MRRRDLLTGAVAAAALGLPRAARAAEDFAPRPGPWRRYEVVTRLDLPRGAAAQAWVPLPSVADVDWVRPLGSAWRTQAGAELVREPRYGVEMLHLT